MRRFSRALAALLMLVVASIVAAPGQARADQGEVVDVYAAPGIHNVNGRQWFTSCEPYSQTFRCRTQIMATVVREVDGKFVQVNRWTFNNLTYQPSARSLWAGNPLAAGGEYEGKAQWTAEDGRNWRTECDTAVSGRNGCRSYVEARVIEAVPGATGTSYQWVTKWVFNNIVRFGEPAPVPGNPDYSAIEDPNLAQCIIDALGSDLYVYPPIEKTLQELDCTGRGISSLAGFPDITGLEVVRLGDNEITSVAPLGDLTGLRTLQLEGNAGITDLAVLRPLVDAGCEIDIWPGN